VSSRGAGLGEEGYDYDLGVAGLCEYCLGFQSPHTRGISCAIGGDADDLEER
jgi:hypothetical protein